MTEGELKGGSDFHQETTTKANSPVFYANLQAQPLCIICLSTINLSCNVNKNRTSMTMVIDSMQQGDTQHNMPNLWYVLLIALTCKWFRVLHLEQRCRKQMDEWENVEEVKVWNQHSSVDITALFTLLACVLLRCMKCFLGLCFAHCWLCLLLRLFSAQGYVYARRECMAPGVMNATQVSSTSAAPAADPASVTTTPTTATHSPVSVLRTQNMVVSEWC